MSEPVSAERLSPAFAELQMPGVVALINMVMESKKIGREILEVGSSSIGEKLYIPLAVFYKSTAVKFPDEPFSFFYLGRRASRDGKRPGRTILEHLALLHPVAQEVPKEAREGFDLFCATLSESWTRVAAGDVEGTDTEGHYRIARDEWNRAKRDPTFTPTKVRIPQLSVDAHVPQTRFDAPFKQ